MFRSLKSAVSSPKPAGTKSEPVHIFFSPVEAKKIAGRYSGVLLPGDAKPKRTSSCSRESSPLLSSRASTDVSESRSRRNSTESFDSDIVIIDMGGRPYSPDSPTSSEQVEPIIGGTSSQFYQDFTRGLYSFYDLTEGGALQEQKLALATDDPQAMTETLKLYFGSEMRAQQSQRIGQGFAVGVLPYLKKISDRVPCTPNFHIEFIRVQGEAPEGSRIYIRFLTVHDTLVDSSGGVAVFAEQPTITMELDSLKTLQQIMRNKNKGKPFSEWAFCSVDEIYELAFTGSVDQGPDFLCVQPPILSLYNPTLYPETCAAEFANQKALSPKDRLEVVLTKLASKRLKFDFSKPILTQEQSVEDEKLPTKARILGMLDTSLSGENRRGFGTLCDHMQIDRTIRQHIKGVFGQIQDNPIPSDEHFIPKLRKHIDESIFDSEGNLQVWVQQALSPSSAIHIERFSRYLSSIFTIARKGIQKEDGELHSWLDPHFGTDPEQKLEPKKSRLTQAKDKLGKDLLSGCLMTSLVLRLSSIPLSPSLAIMPKQVVLVTMRLIEHQNTLNTQFLEEAKKLNDLLGAQSQNDFCQLPEFKNFFSQIEAAKRQIPLGDTGKLTHLIKLVNKTLELGLRSDSIAYFYAVEKFKEEVKEFKKDNVSGILRELEQGEIPTIAMRKYVADKFRAIQGGLADYKLISEMPNKIESKSAIERKEQGMKRGATPKSSIPRLHLIYQLAKEEKASEFVSEIFTLIPREAKLSEEERNADYWKVYFDAIREYQKSLTDSTARPEKFTCLLKLINRILALDADGADGILSKLSAVTGEFNKIKDDAAKLTEFNAFVNQLLEKLTLVTTQEGEAKADSELSDREQLREMYKAFTAIYAARYPSAVSSHSSTNIAVTAAKSDLGDSVGSSANQPQIAAHTNTATSNSCYVYLKMLAGLTLAACAVALLVFFPHVSLLITLPHAKLAAGALGVVGVGLFACGGYEYLRGPEQVQAGRNRAPLS